MHKAHGKVNWMKQDISLEKSKNPVTEKLRETLERLESISDAVTCAGGNNSPAMDSSCNTYSSRPTTSDAEMVEKRYPLRVNRGRPSINLKIELYLVITFFAYVTNAVYLSIRENFTYLFPDINTDTCMLNGGERMDMC